MDWLRVLLSRCTAFFRTKALADDLHEELHSHIAFAIEENLRRGMSERDARLRALDEFGGLTQVKEAYHRQQTLPLLETLTRDVGYALRQLRQSPGFAITAIVTLALGIGANTVMFTLVNSILLRPLPFAHQDRLMRISGTTSEVFPKGWIRELTTHSSSFAAISGFGADVESNISIADSPDRVFGAAVMVNAFDTLGIHPALGSFFTKDDAQPGQDLEAVLSYGYWRQHFGDDPGVIGRHIRIDGVSRRIIGVMPAGVHFPYADTQFVTPVAFRGGDSADAWKDFDLRAFGRLKDGVTPGQAQAELRRLHALLLPLFPWRMPDVWASDMTVVPLLQFETGAVRPRLVLLFGAVGLILLIACANVANLILARAAGREREIAIRGALGASGRRLIQQLLSESLVLGLLAGIVGLIAAATSLQVFVRLLPADTPRLEDVSLHPSVLLFACGASVLAGFLFGLVPAIKSTSLSLVETLRSGSRSLAGTVSQFRLSMMLVMGQIGLSVVVIAAAGLMLHSLYKLSRVDPGFRTDRVVTAEISLDAAACREKGRCQSFFAAMIDRARGLEGSEGVALTDSLPLSGWNNNYVYDAEGHPRDPRQGARLATRRTVSPGYFAALNLRLLRGRLLSESDASGASRAVVINERMAESLWPHQDPLGKHIVGVADERTPAVWDPNVASIVVGVVRNSRQGSLDSGFSDEVYLPMTVAREQPAMYALVRTRAAPSEAAAGLRRVVAGINRLAPVTRVRTMDEVVAASVSASRSLAVLLLGFGALAVVIGAVGVYSLIAYMVSWRTREIGIRLALGARRWQIVSAIVKQSLLLAAGGSLAGLIVAVALTRLLHGFLFEVSAIDPLTFSAVPVIMMLVALIAAGIPAWRAAALDPIRALRAE